MMTTRAARLLILAFLAAGATPAMAQGRQMILRPQGDPGTSGYNSTIVSMPLTPFSRDTTIHFEYNLQGKASLALEGQFAGNHEELSADEQQQDGGSMMDQDKAATLLISRYTDAARLAGFYWSLGLGYRQQLVKWQVKPDANDPEQKSMGLADSAQLLNHDVVMTGTTGHLRAGYRYVGSELPFEIGLYAGIQHYQAGVKDAPDVAKPAAGQDAYDPTSSEERDRLLHRFETQPEGGLELGFAF